MARTKKETYQEAEKMEMENNMTSAEDNGISLADQIEEEFEAAAEDAEHADEDDQAVGAAADDSAAPTSETPESSENDEELIMTPDDVRLVEAMLFASATAISEGQIAERFPADRVKLIPDVLEYLRQHYESRGVVLVQREKRWALRTATDLGDQLRLEKEQPKKFTRAAMETMAVVAYHQPVTRAEIENIRGVATSPGALDALMEAGWIKPGKRREVPGRPVTWLSTQAFLDHFGLEKLGDLPGMEELKAAGLLDKRPAIEAMPTADMFDNADTAREMADPQEVTDEDLIGDSAPSVEEDEDADTVAQEGDDEDMDEEDTGGEDDLDDEDEKDDDNDADDEDDGEFADDGEETDTDDSDDEDLDDESDEDDDDDYDADGEDEDSDEDGEDDEEDKD